MTKTEYVFTSLPQSLLRDFCEFEGVGDTVGDLADAYVYNTICGRKYKAQVEEQRGYINDLLKENKGKENGV